MKGRLFIIVSMMPTQKRQTNSRYERMNSGNKKKNLKGFGSKSIDSGKISAIRNMKLNKFGPI